MNACRRPARLALLLLVLPVAAQARDVELSLALGAGYPVKRNLYLVDDQGGGSSTFVQTQFSGPWLLGGARASYELLKTGPWKFWAGAGYETGLGSPSYYKTGQATVQAASSTTETLNGTAKYARYQIGLGATLATGTIGEYGAYLWRRAHRTSLDGTLSTYQVQGTELTSGNTPFSMHASDYDYMLELSMGFVQPRPTYKTFERIAFGTAFGPGFGLVNAGNWQISPAFAERLRPTLEISFSFGVRL